MDEILILQVLMRKVKGTEKDYELITILDEAFKGLSKEAQETINEISEQYIKTIKDIIKMDKDTSNILN